MSDSNRSERTEALGPVFAIFAAILLVAVVVGVLSYSQGVESERRNNAPAAYAEAAKEHAGRACRESEAATVFECVYEIVESSQQQAQAEQDLDAQQGMQFWAAVMAAMAAGSLLLTGVTVLLIKQTLDATADMLGEAKELTQETIKATNAMIKANEIALHAQRPWLQIEARLREIHIQDERNDFYFEAVITNIGKMVAERCAVRIAIVDDDTNAAGQRKIEKARVDAENAACGGLPEGRSPYPMLPNQSEISGVKRESFGQPWQTLPDGRQVLRITFFVAVRYFLPGDEVMRRTDRAFCLTYIPEGAARDDLTLPFGIFRPLPNNLNVDTVWLRPAGHNITT